MDSSKAAGASQAGAIANLVAATVAAVSLTVIVAAGVLVLARDRSPAVSGFDLQRLPAQTRHAYEIALSHRDLFVHLPCYCGCAVLPEPHRNLVDCFVDASGEFATHAGSCSTCVDIALEAWRANEQGLGHAQIRALVDERFSGRGPGTATSYP